MPGALRLGLLACLLAAPLAAAAATPVANAVANFGLLDQHGRYHQLHDEAHRRAVVLFVQGNGCPIVRKNVPALLELRARFAPEGVTFWMINASPQDDRGEIAREAEAWGIDVPILKDEGGIVGRGLGLVRTAEAILIDPSSWRIVYRGPIDDRLSYEAERPVRERWLADALAAHMAGRPVATPEREPRGCLLGHEAGAASADAPSYAADVAPILAARCRSCHRAGGPAPWRMTDWATVRGWAPMMGEVLRTGRMPPWRIDPHVGRFRDALALPTAERATLVRWIEAGAPRGTGPDPLAESPADPVPEWPLGPPDLVIEAPEQRLPASGVIPYLYEHVEVGVDRELWLRAVDVRPSNPAVMHHAVVQAELPGDPGWRRDEPRFVRGYVGAYVPGRRPVVAPPGTGVRVPAGAVLRFQLHYTATGRPETDVPRVGLYLHDAPPEREIRVAAVANWGIEIPPGEPEHVERASQRIERNITLYSLIPHMHFRGKRFRHELRYPDGRVETLLSVPRYDFNWQHRYELETPLRIPAGSRMEVTAVFDNSAHNPANPNPDTWVYFGEQSFDEMLLGYYTYTLDADEPTRTAER